MKSKKRIALLACSNGIGHVRRLLALSLELCALGAKPVLLAEEFKLRRLCEIYQLSMPEFINYSSRIKRGDWTSEEMPDFTSDLPDLDSYDIVVSDNLVQVLIPRPDAWLSGSFFWHRAMGGVPHTKTMFMESLLQQFRPRMISSHLFAATYLQIYCRLSLVGLYDFPGTSLHSQKTDFLISCGTGGDCKDETSELIIQLSRGPRPIDGTIWIEPELHSSYMPHWIQPATFSRSMFARIVCAIIRPGVGTLTDALLAGARVFCFYEADNEEMFTNAANVAAAGLGEDCKSPIRAWQTALKFLGNVDDRQAHYIAAKSLDRGGARQAAKLILPES